MDQKIFKDFLDKPTMAQKLLAKYPDKIPILVHAKNIEISKKKFLVSNDCTLGYFNVHLRRYTKIRAEEGMVIFIDNTLPKMTDTVGMLYSQYANEEDHYLHIVLTKENVFG